MLYPYNQSRINVFYLEEFHNHVHQGFSKKNGNLIIAGHSGTGWKAFFNDLYQLNIGDQAIVTYKNRKYTYQIENISKQAKTGTLTIKRNKKRLILKIYDLLE